MHTDGPGEPGKRSLSAERVIIDGPLSRTGDHLRIAIGDGYIVAGPYNQDPVEMDPDEAVRIGRALVDAGNEAASRIGRPGGVHD
ncbi:hypothetical protein [Saccharopolyspora sp. 6V]|uniref:hypothetical protein n=1 Tax=Saccharopolyspora sp. 6V TaxID=2877239 RepID=UPI001CD399E2|nr:hypothetical protein [Saccharopolyspora sp. 6V]MCA1195100.1 hypothetical protein [Saccharopolyspora sp. 6V]